jgi:RNA polymerase sigma factor (sigma-70 family)
MESSEAGSSRPGGHRRKHACSYVIPSAGRLEPAEEAALGERVQLGNKVLSDLLGVLAPRVISSLRELDCKPYTAEELEPSVREGLEVALDGQSLEKDPGCQFVESAVLRVRATVGTHINSLACNGEPPPDGDGWASERVTPALLEGCCQGVQFDGSWAELAARQAALQRFVEGSFHIVQAVTKSFLGRGFDLEDLLQEGTLAVRNAALKFVPGDGKPFGPYVRKAVRNHLTDLIRTSQGLTAHIARQVARFKLERQRLALAQGRAPSDEEIFTALGWSRTKRRNVEHALASGQPQSLEAHEEQSGEPAEDSLARDPPADAEHSEALVRLEGVYEQLDETEKQVIRLRHRGPEILTQAQTAKRLGLTLHEVRKTETGAMKKLQAPFREEITAPERDGSPG